MWDIRLTAWGLALLLKLYHEGCTEFIIPQNFSYLIFIHKTLSFSSFSGAFWYFFWIEFFSMDGVRTKPMVSDQIRSVAQSSNSLQPHESKHTRPPCPSPTPGVHSDSRPLSQWCHPAISFSVIPFSSCPQSLSIRVFSNESTLRMSWPKYWSFSFSILPSKEIPGLISFRMD